ncbi:MAG: putative glycoside hydrolase [Planctomycetota bacterium]
MLKLLNKWILVYVIIGTSSLSCMAKPPLPSTGSSIGITFLRKPELARKIRGRNVGLTAEEIFQNLSRYDAVFQGQDIINYSRPGWNFVRKYAPEKLLLRYNSSVTSRDVKGHILDYNYINTYHPEWFLVKDAKNPLKADPRNPVNRIRWATNDKTSHYYNRFYIDVCNEEFQDWAVQRILYHVSGKASNLDQPYRGLAFDNVVFQRIKERFKAYPNWNYANNISEWKEGFLNYLRKVHKALTARGYIFVSNLSYYWHLETYESDLYDLMNTVDGILHEWHLGYGTQYWSGDKWLRSIQRHEAVVNKGLIDWWACYPAEEPEPGKKHFLYAYCSFLLVKRPGYSLFYASSDRGWGRNRKVPWYDEYDLQIGEPLSRRYFRDGCWFRNYRNAMIVVNPEKVSRSVVIDTNKVWLDWITKKAVSKLTLPPKSGRILLATPYKTEAQIPGLEK